MEVTVLPLSIELMKKLREAYQRRSVQVRKIREHMNSSPHPIILCGDFNDTPTSYAYHILSKRLKDSYVKRGSGLGTTYNGNLPNLRIDYVFADPFISILDHDLIHTDLSDHYPISVTLEIQE